MIYRELREYSTPLGLKKTTRAELCERIICGHIIYKIDLVPAIFSYMTMITGLHGWTSNTYGPQNAQGLDINYPQIREHIVTALSGDCFDEQYTTVLTRIYDSSPFFQAYFNYNYVMRRNEINIKDLIIPLVDCVKNAGKAVLHSAKGTYLTEDSGYIYVLDAYVPALQKLAYVAIG